MTESCLRLLIREQNSHVQMADIAAKSTTKVMGLYTMAVTVTATNSVPEMVRVSKSLIDLTAYLSSCAAGLFFSSAGADVVVVSPCGAGEVVSLPEEVVLLSAGVASASEGVPS